MSVFFITFVLYVLQFVEKNRVYVIVINRSRNTNIGRTIDFSVYYFSNK